MAELTSGVAEPGREVGWLPPGPTVLAVEIEMLRRGWPEQVLTGRYSIATYLRNAGLQRMYDGLDLLTDGLISKDPERELHLWIDGQAVMIVLKGAYPGLPLGIKLCAGVPLAPLLVLHQREVRRSSRLAWLFNVDPACYDVFDCRLGAVIGSLAATGGFVRPARTVIHDSSGQVVGRLTQPGPVLLRRWLQLGRNRYDVIVGGVRVAVIQQASRRSDRAYEVDVTGAAGLLDPRLILACALQKFGWFSTY